MIARKLEIRGTVVLITGAGKGIGRALVDEILQRGGRPIAVEFDPKLVDELTSAIGTVGAVHIADVRDAQAMEAVAAQTIEQFGGIDIVVANAGIERVAPTVDMPGTTFETVLATNIQGVYRTLKPALGSVIARKGHVLAGLYRRLDPVPNGDGLFNVHGGSRYDDARAPHGTYWDRSNSGRSLFRICTNRHGRPYFL